MTSKQAERSSQSHERANDNAATSKQLAFIRKLSKERGFDLDELIDRIASGEKSVSKHEASRWIDALLDMRPVSCVDVMTQCTKPGYYVLNDVVFVVVKSKTNPDRTYAKRLVVSEYGHASWQYESGAAKKLVDAVPLTLEEAKKLGHMYGVCCVCGRTLTDPQSVELGIGPICAKRL